MYASTSSDRAPTDRPPQSTTTTTHYYQLPHQHYLCYDAQKRRKKNHHPVFNVIWPAHWIHRKTFFFASNVLLQGLALALARSDPHSLSTATPVHGPGQARQGLVLPGWITPRNHVAGKICQGPEVRLSRPHSESASPLETKLECGSRSRVGLPIWFQVPRWGWCECHRRKATLGYVGRYDAGTEKVFGKNNMYDICKIACFAMLHDSLGIHTVQSVIHPWPGIQNPYPKPLACTWNSKETLCRRCSVKPEMCVESQNPYIQIPICDNPRDVRYSPCVAPTPRLPKTLIVDDRCKINKGNKEMRRTRPDVVIVCIWTSEYVCVKH